MNSKDCSILRVLVIRADRIGDLMHVTPVLHALQEQYPGTVVDVLAKAPATEVLCGNPSVTRVLDARWDDARLRAAIAKGNYQAVVHLFPDLRLIALCDSIPRSSRKGWLPWPGRHRRVVLHRSRARKSEALYNADLLLPWFPHLKVDPRPHLFPSESARRRAAMLMAQARPLLNPGSGHPEGSWPWDRFAEVARKLRPTLGRALVVWGPGEEELARKVAMAGEAELAPATSLHELAALAERAVVMVTNDTGPMHIGAAVGVPLVVVWDGSRAIRPKRWGHWFRRDIINLDPYDGSADEVALRQRRLSSITIDMVVTAVKQVVRAEGSGPSAEP